MMAGAMAASVIARARFRRASASVSFPQPQLHDAGKPTAHNGHLCYARRSGWEGLSETRWRTSSELSAMPLA